VSRETSELAAADQQQAPAVADSNQQPVSQQPEAPSGLPDMQVGSIVVVMFHCCCCCCDYL